MATMRFMNGSVSPLARVASLGLASSVALVAASCMPSLPFEEDGVSVLRGGDLLAARGGVVVADAVPGDVMAAGAEVRFTGTAGGDLLVAAGTNTLAGTVDGSVRAAGRDVRVSTAVGRNATLAGGLVILEREGRIAGNAYLAGGAVRVGGTVDRLLRIMARDVVLDGVVGGGVLVEADRLRVGPNAVIGGGIRYRLSRGEEVDIDPAARIEGDVIGLDARRRLPIRAVIRWLSLAGFLFAGAVMVALLPRATLVAESRVRARPAASLGVGILMLLVIPLVVAAIAITVIGIPLALVTAALYGSAAYLAPVVVAVWLGRLVVPGGSYPDRGVLVLAFLLGGVALGLLALIPYAGLAIRLLAAAVGLGAISVALWEGAVRVEPVA